MNRFRDLNAQILQLLEADSRLTNSELGRRLGVSEAVVRQRLRRIFDGTKVRRGVVVDFSVLGIEVVACVKVRVLATELECAARKLSDQPGTGLVMSTTGSWNLFTMVATRDFAELTRYVDDAVRTLDGFVDVEVLLISEALKYDVRDSPLVVLNGSTGN